MSPLGAKYLTGSAAARANLVARASGTLNFKFGKAEIAAEIRPGQFRFSDWSLELSVDGQPFAFHISQPTLLALLSTIEPALVLEPPPLPSIIALLADTLLPAILAKHEPLLGSPTMLVGTVPIEAGFKEGVAVRFTIDGMPHRGALNGQEIVDDILRRWPARQHRLSQLRLASWISLGWTELSVTVIEALEPGDAIRIERRPAAPAMSGETIDHSPRATLLVAGGWSAVVQKRRREWMIMEAIGPKTTNLEDGEVAEGGNASLDSLPVRLDFNVGHRELSLAELRLLQPGAVLRAGTSTPEVVEITVHGRRVGTGELVEVEGTVAIRVIRLFGLD